MGINSHKLREAIQKNGYSSTSIAEIVNQKHDEASLKKHDVDNLVHCSYNKLQKKTIRKLELVAEALNQNIANFLTGEDLRQFSQSVNNPSTNSKFNYDGSIYRTATEIVEKLFDEFNIEITPQIIHEYALETHDASITNSMESKEVMEGFARGLVRSSLMNGILITRKD